MNGDFFVAAYNKPRSVEFKLICDCLIWRLDRPASIWIVTMIVERLPVLCFINRAVSTIWTKTILLLLRHCCRTRWMYPSFPVCQESLVCSPLS
jgi:hypothetical protein